MNSVEVCNLALSRIGQGASKPIQSLTADTSEPAKACARVFAIAMQCTLRESVDWPFARKALALAVTAQVVPGWDYAYAYPADCLRVQALSDVDTDPFRGNGPVCRIPYKLMAATNDESLVIATDLTDAWAWMTADATNPHFADALFQDALAWRIAAEVALGLKADPTMARNAGDQYKLAISKAAAATGNEAVGDAPPDADNIRVRC